MGFPFPSRTCAAIQAPSYLWGSSVCSSASAPKPAPLADPTQLTLSQSKSAFRQQRAGAAAKFCAGLAPRSSLARFLGWFSNSCSSNSSPSSWAGLKDTGAPRVSKFLRARVCGDRMVGIYTGKSCSHPGMMFSGLTDRSAHGSSNRTPMALTQGPGDRTHSVFLRVSSATEAQIKGS